MDALYLGLVALFFGLLVLMVLGCNHLGDKK